MNAWEKALVGPEATLLKTMEALDRGAARIALVVDGEGVLLGVATDGDVRRGILRGLSLEAPVSRVMRREFVRAAPDTPTRSVLALMRERDIQQVPLVDARGRLVGMRCLSDIMGSRARPNTAVIMAGGQGQRLRPLTENCPKPLLKVGGRPVIDTILERLMAAGLRRFYISVNYLAPLIKEHLGDGSALGVRIEYLEEDERLGTAGALGLFPAAPEEAFVVTNGDILTRLDFGALLDFHAASGAQGTMGVREYRYQVPYGVIQSDGKRLVGIEEKPVQHHFVNAGIYVFSPEALEFVKKGEQLDMPGLFTRLTEARREAAVYPIFDYWTDIGSPEDLRRAEREYGEVFG